MSKERQHYVPRCYLDSFCDAQGHLHVYDKTTGRTFVSRPDSVAVEKDFYSLPPELTGTGDQRELETALSPVEADASDIIRNWTAGIDSPDFRILPAQRERFSLFIALQFFRTKEHRIIISEFKKRILSPDQEMTEEGELHNHLLWNSDLVQNTADRLSQFIWIVAKNESSVPFLASDHPVVTKDSASKHWLTTPKLTQPGVQVILPLTPRLILYCKEPNHWNTVSRFDSLLSPVAFTDYMAHHENSGQIGVSTRFVFSSTPSFSIAEEYCEQNPEIHDPDRERFG